MKIVSKALIFNNDQQILVLRRNPTHPNFPHHYDFPGGEVEKNESPDNATKREIFEETGIVIDLAGLNLVLEKKESRDLQYLVFVCNLKKTEQAVTLSWEHESYQWMSIEDLLNKPVLNNFDQYYLLALSYLKNQKTTHNK
jgi:8-oxo-dGTP diphosphatase